VGDLRSARRGVAIVFFVYGAVLATWVSRIPLVKQELGLDTAQLSLALVGSPVGLILAMQAVAALVGRWTSAVVTRAALVGPAWRWCCPEWPGASGRWRARARCSGPRPTGPPSRTTPTLPPCASPSIPG
jgi:hypothetical protein